MPDDKTTITCQQLLDNLNKDWKTYPERFLKLDPDQQANFLKEQGYDSFHDLLAHIIAWWQEAIKIIDAIMDMEEPQRKEYNIDDFNSAAIERYRNWKDTDLMFHFENSREALINLVAELPENGLNNKRINNWLNACVVEHFHTHDIS
jgi:hypothetical protein